MNLNLKLHCKSSRFIWSWCKSIKMWWYTWIDTRLYCNPLHKRWP